jgi:hypothetical protein
MAGVAHGSSYLSYDIDIVYERSVENLERLATVLAGLDVTLQLRTLRELVARMDGSRSPDEILRDPVMPVARGAAAAALRSLNRVAGS